MTTQIKNFFKIDQEIIYMIQHPRKVKSRNVLKLLSAIIIFLMLLCGILHLTGSSYQCKDLIEKIKVLAEQLGSHTIKPMEALRRVREWLAGAWNSIKDSAPVTGVLGLMGSKYLALKDQIFTAPPDEITPPPPPPTTTKSFDTDTFNLKYYRDITFIPKEHPVKQVLKKTGGDNYLISVMNYPVVLEKVEAGVSTFEELSPGGRHTIDKSFVTRHGLDETSKLSDVKYYIINPDKTDTQSRKAVTDKRFFTFSD